MTREELIRMGAASGLSYYGMGKDRERFIAHMQRFADMVLAAQPLPGPDSDKVRLFNDRMALTEEALTAMKVIAAADEREACAKLAGRLWQQFQDTKDAHERNTMESFKPDQFGFNLSAVQQSQQMMDAIRARSKDEK